MFASLTPEIIAQSLGGGALIGLSAALLWRGLGRVAGVSGICGVAFARGTEDRPWRLFFLIAMIATGLIISVLSPASFSAPVAPSLGWLMGSGMLVGFGTRLGSGCTSGHGVCGMSRASPRSFVATLTFIGAGMATVAALRLVGVLS